MASWWTLTTLKQPSNWFYLLYKHLKKQTIRGSTLLPTRILLRMYKCRTDGLQGVWRGLTEATFQKKNIHTYTCNSLSAKKEERRGGDGEESAERGRTKTRVILLLPLPLPLLPSLSAVFLSSSFFFCAHQRLPIYHFVAPRCHDDHLSSSPEIYPCNINYTYLVLDRNSRDKESL